MIINLEAGFSTKDSWRYFKMEKVAILKLKYILYVYIPTNY
jgi:hypothetical protein